MPEPAQTFPGARWWKFDFHAHTPASADARDLDPATSKPVTPADWLIGFMRAGVDCVAVTDHNSGAWIDRLKQELAAMRREPPEHYRPLHLFPGVELSVSAGFHLLAIFGPQAGTSEVTSLLGSVGYGGTHGNAADATRKSPVEVVEEVLRAGAIPIPAHADDTNGLLRLRCPERGTADIHAATVKQVLEMDGILAVETLDRGSPRPGIFRELAVPWTEVLGSDFHPPAAVNGGPQPGSRFTWVKMAAPSLEGLRLALLDGARFSIRRSDEGSFDPHRLPEHRIESIEIRDARVMGRGKPAKLSFNPLLNAIVGGRGTGKSTVVHALRLAAGREGEIGDLQDGSIPRATFEQFNKVYKNRTDDGALTKDTVITWTVRRKGVRYRITARPRGGRAELDVEEQNGAGAWIVSAARSVTPTRFPVRIYSQGQIAELAGESRLALLKLIDEAADGSRLVDDLREACGGYRSSAARIRELDRGLARRDRTVVDLEDVNRKLVQFEKRNHSAVLRRFREVVRQQREADRLFEAADDSAGRIDALAAQIHPEDLPDGVVRGDSKEDAEYLGVVAGLARAVGRASNDVRGAAANLREAAQNQRRVLEEGSWQAAAAKAVAANSKLVSELRAAGVSDPGQYGRLLQERRRLQREIEALDSRKADRDRLKAESSSRLEGVREARRAISRGRKDFLAETLADNKFVRVAVRRYGDDPRDIERSLRRELGITDDRFENDILVMEDGRPQKGIVEQLLRRLPGGERERSREMERRLDTLKERLESACAGKPMFGARFNRHLARRCEQDPTLPDRLWTWFPDDGLGVEYSRSGNGTDFQPIAQASAGQRSAAMLSFLLAYGNDPLVLDQPEDDLDNHLIYDLVVRQIRESKLRRQIIVVTHNPNIVVNGDAEMLHTLEFGGGQCFVEHRGSLQEPDIREVVCRVMEGGREAFERRYRRLGGEPADV